MNKKPMSDDRRRQVATTKKRYGEDHYKKLGAKSATFKDPEMARRAVNKRWHPEWYDKVEKVIKEELE